MAILRVERIGGLAGFGGVNSHVRSRGQLEIAALSAAEQQAVEALFQSHGKEKASQMRDGFRYKITRITSAKSETIEAPESVVPVALVQCVKDEIV
jgi:Emfourin